MKKVVSGMADRARGIMDSMLSGSYSPKGSSFGAVVGRGLVGASRGKVGRSPDMSSLGGVVRSFVTKSKRVPYGNDF